MTARAKLVGSISHKDLVLRIYPTAYAMKDIDGFWFIWRPFHPGALNGGKHDTRSAAGAWRVAAERLIFGTDEERSPLDEMREVEKIVFA